VAKNRDLTGGGFDKSLEDFDGGGLPRSVRTQKAKALSGLDFQTQPADGFDFTVVGLAQVAALDGSGHAKILNEGL
jgi:hypothetical protein